MHSIVKKILLYLPRFFFKRADGGSNSGVTGYMLIEWKKVCSIGFLHFNTGSREAFHSHSFNAITWWLSGAVREVHYPSRKAIRFIPSFRPKITPRSCFHKIIALKPTWAFTIRGPWKDTWQELRVDQELVTLTHGRSIVANKEEG